MATYLKRTSKLFDLSQSRPSADVCLRDLMCPVCRGILIEPVTLPCTHNLCLRCLKGTFEHNSLSCPLCRLRVGSWLRTATKSETLVNHGLWEFIRTKFSKEVEDKHNGEERDLGLDAADFAANRILSAAGEIHREYEAQLQIAEEEMRRQRQAERRASEALIQKIQAEEQQLLLAQLAQDQLLAKNLAKKQVAEKQKEAATKCYNDCLNTSAASYTYDVGKYHVKSARANNAEAPQAESTHPADGKRTSLPESVRGSSELRRTNMALLSKICAERYCKVKSNAPSTYKNCCPKQLAVYNVVTKSFKQQAVPRYIQPCTSNYPMDPGCSTSQAYATETKEELRVPSDVVNSKKKSLEVEVCRTHGSPDPHRTDDDERIGSAESSGSHDSINQEIHHFKPIKTVPRTSFKVSSDGKQIDPKLIRVVPIMKRVINAVLKPPSPTHLKRIIGCSWSAFRGKARQDAREKQAARNVGTDTTASIDQKPSTSLNQPQTVPSKSAKPQTSDARLDFILESSFDSNKNYTKSVNKIVNGTKVSKKLTLDDESDARTTRKCWRTRVRNGMVTKRHRNVRYRKGAELTLDEEVDEKEMEEDDPRTPSPSCGKTSPQNDERDGEVNDVAIENIAERIKRRKVNVEKKKLPEADASSKRSTRKRVLSERRDKSSSSRENGAPRSVSKRRRLRRSDAGKSESSRNATMVGGKVAGKRSAECNNGKFSYDSPPESCDETEEAVVNEKQRHERLSDREVIEEQQRIEQVLLQEREDYELARRLQAKFDEMERVARRTRRSRRAVEDETSFDVAELREIAAVRTVARKAKPSLVVRTAKTVPKKKRGRPPKRVK
ncbi:PREDICTED: uncharacterized protein LOC106743182 [Dinoponera quadriceps]|uniref:RING-type E3 ubiquitin transferase n=1 Tax=Dinoponera quadriceps TaxID=609295 RepID=A0A6P3X318_DINQU|nr:PREDICTED: uncharacterized protein LOC106743182 [Dinoponera quadriceps]